MKAVLLVENGDGTTTTMHVDAADVVVSQQSQQAQSVYYNPSVLRAVSVIPAAVRRNWAPPCRPFVYQSRCFRKSLGPTVCP